MATNAQNNMPPMMSPIKNFMKSIAKAARREAPTQFYLEFIDTLTKSIISNQRVIIERVNRYGITYVHNTKFELDKKYFDLFEVNNHNECLSRTFTVFEEPGYNKMTVNVLPVRSMYDTNTMTFNVKISWF